MVLVCFFLWLHCLNTLVIVLCVGQDYFTIIRSSPGSLSDKFIVPKSKCGSTSLSCSALYSGATNHDPTQCKCACRYEYSTFALYRGGWICMKNSQVRQLTGCQFMFDGEYSNNPLKVLSASSSPRVILPSSSCTIDQPASRYLECDGTWTAIRGQSNIFRFWPVTENIGPNKYRHAMRVGTASVLAGRIVSLKVTCKNPSKSSCLLFKTAGQLNCSVNIVRSTSTQTPLFTVTSQRTTQTPSSDASTRNSSIEVPGPDKGMRNSGQSWVSSGTVAAVVIVIIIVIILIAIIGFVVWKKRRGENVLFMDHLINIARKARSPPSKKPEEPQEQIYAEIPEQPIQRQTVTAPSAPTDGGIYSFAFDDPNSPYAPPNQPQINKNCSKIPGEAPTDDGGYLVPVDSPFHSVHKDPGQQNAHSNAKNPYLNDIRQEEQRPTYGGGVRSNDVAPFYDVLEEDTENNEKDNPDVCYNQQPSSAHRGGGRGNFKPYVSAPGTAGAGGNEHVTKQRRRPPSPPRNIVMKQEPLQTYEL